MSDTTPKPPCAVCGGEYSTHFVDGKQITQHMYTENPGELVTQQEKAKEKMMTGQMARPAQVNPAMMMASGSNPVSFGRLVEVLMEKGVIEPGEALYIGMMGVKPQKEFIDPAAAFGMKPANGGL